MLQQRIEARWIDAFVRVYRLCGVQVGESAAILSETQSRAVNVQLAELALAQLGARAFHVVVPTPALTAPVPVRSTGASDAIGGLAPAVQALATSTDRTVEGLLHAPELPGILASGAHVAALRFAREVMAKVPQVSYRAALQAIVSFNQSEDLARIQVPVLCLCGERDRNAAPHVMQRKAERIAQGRYQYVAGVGHLANMEHPQVFNGAALQFLQRFFPV